MPWHDPIWYELILFNPLQLLLHRSLLSTQLCAFRTGLHVKCCNNNLDHRRAVRAKSVSTCRPRHPCILVITCQCRGRSIIVNHQVISRFIKEMRCFLGLFALFALLSFVMASEVNVMSPRKEDDVCFKCAKSYYDCFKLFGKTGCTAKNAEHHSWCRECTGIDPPW